jgi:hypothetical protein
MLRQTLLGFAVLSFCAAVPANDQEVKLLLKFKEGETFWVEEVEACKEDSTIMAQAITTNSKTTTITRYHVKKVTHDSVVLTMTIEDVNVESDGGPGDLFDNLDTNLKGATLIVTMTLDGKLKKVDGVSDFIKEMDDVSAFIKELNEETSKQIMTDFVNGEVRSRLQNAFGFVPDKALKTGDTWNLEPGNNALVGPAWTHQAE